MYYVRTIMASVLSVPKRRSIMSANSPSPALPFEVGSEYRNSGFMKFRVGTCEGLWRASEKTYDILAVHNSEKGNGHFKEALKWFEASCRRDGKSLRFLFCINPFFAYQCWKHGCEWKPFFNWVKHFD